MFSHLQSQLPPNTLFLKNGTSYTCRCEFNLNIVTHFNTSNIISHIVIKYRKILNELADTPAITVTKMEEESNSSQTSQDDGEGNEAATNLSTNTVGK